MGLKLLCRNTFRIFKHKKMQLLAIGIIIFLSSFLYTMMYYALDSMKSSMEQSFEQGNQEDFSISIVDGIMPSEIEYMLKNNGEEWLSLRLSELKEVDKKLYTGLIRRRQEAFKKVYPQYQLEPRVFKDVSFNREGSSHKLRVFEEAREINKAYVEEGRLPQTSKEIALTRVYSEANNLEIGDHYSIKDETYTITGYITLPDMNLVLIGNDFIFDPQRISIAIVNGRSFEKLKGEEGLYIAGKFKEKRLQETFKKDVIDTFKEEPSLDFITAIIATENQMRSGAIYTELEGSTAITLGLSMMISSIAVLVVAILIAKILKNERKQIGTLKALGYSSVEVTLPYIFLLLWIACPMLIMGHLLGLIMAEPLKNFYLMFYLLPNQPIQIQFSTLLISIGMPLFFILGFSFIIIRRLLSKPAITLMKVAEKEKLTKLNKWALKVLKNAKVQTKYTFTFIFKNTGKFIVFFWGMSFATYLIVVSLMMAGFFDKMTIDYYKSTAYTYEGQLDFTKPKPRLTDQQEKYLIAPTGFYKEDQIAIKGIESQSRLHKLYDSENKEITNQLKEGIVINESFKITYGVKVGEVIFVTLDDEVYKWRIQAVSKDYGSPTVYCNRENLSQILTKGKTSKFYNGVYSLTPLDEDEYAVIINKADIMQQSQMMQQFMKIAIYSMVGVAVFIAALILYILTTLTVEDQYYTISLLKVMGYSKKEVQKMILDSYFIYAILTYIITVPITVVSMKVLMIYFSRAFDMVMPMSFSLGRGMIGLLLMIVMFFGASYSAKRKIEKIPLQEILKTYQE